jgi:putative Ca2+/H+ antiporter (TMEM165/GDT1 family)
MTAFFSIFITVFLAELGDKTQLATVLFASDGGKSKLMVFAAAALALVAGAAADKWLSALPLKLIAGAGFVIIGALMMLDHFRAA